MVEQARLAVFDGGIVRMFAGFARCRAAQAALQRDVLVEHISFDAGQSIRSADLLAGFWRDEAAEMDWVVDFLCNPATYEMMAGLQANEIRLRSPEMHGEEEEEEMLFTKSMLVTTGMDMADYS
jgi:hypothetical protein